MKWVGAITGLVLLATPLAAQDDRTQTLADIRQELTVLFVELRTLKQELNTTGTGGTANLPSSTLDRIGAIENELQRLTARTEQMQFRIDRIVADGTNRVGDLEFRLCELEDGCDIANLGETPTLGGGEQTAAATPAPAQPTTTGPQLAATEQADFERAQEALADGDFRSAADLFASFNATYPGGPLAAAAELGRGEALEGMGDVKEAARAYLSAFSTDQLGATAPDSLFHLGAALGQLGQTQEACVTLAEVPKRYPDAQSVNAEAAAQMQTIGCS